MNGKPLAAFGAGEQARLTWERVPDLPNLTPETSLAAVTRYFAAYNLVCGPVVDDQNNLLGAVTVDDLGRLDSVTKVVSVLRVEGEEE